MSYQQLSEWFPNDQTRVYKNICKELRNPTPADRAASKAAAERKAAERAAWPLPREWTPLPPPEKPPLPSFDKPKLQPYRRCEWCVFGGFVCDSCPDADIYYWHFPKEFEKAHHCTPDCYHPYQVTTEENRVPNWQTNYEKLKTRYPNLKLLDVGPKSENE